jgi:hypothetical protein
MSSIHFRVVRLYLHLVQVNKKIIALLLRVDLSPATSTVVVKIFPL